jgi:exodeoxyribonuclease V alpha subunit
MEKKLIMSDITNVVGYVRKIVFSNLDSHYYILACLVDEEELVIVGNFMGIDEDQTYEFDGEFIEHSTYGLQFKAYNAKLVLPTDKDLVISYLSGSEFSGIGTKLATAIYELFSDEDNILEKIVMEKERLTSIKGLTARKIDNLIRVLNEASQNNKLFEYLKEYNIEYSSVINIYNKTRLDVDEFIAILRNNPYYLMKYHVSFKMIDAFARKLDIDNFNFIQEQGMVYGAIKELSFRQGATYVTKDQIFEKITKPIASLEECLSFLINNDLIVVIKDMVFEKEQYNDEVFIAEYIKEYSKRSDTNDISTYIDEYQSYYGINFNKEQYQAIEHGINIPISIITGGPGTGKSTIVDALIYVINLLDKNYKIGLCAPTGKASKRLAQLTNREAMTIHRLLKFDMHTNTFGKNVYDPLEYDVLIIDEASMIDNFLMASLLKASFNVKKIIILGDYNQLPSVSQGQILKDLIDSKVIATTFLTMIYRQAEGSSIIEFAYQVLKHQHLNDYIIYDDLKLIDINDEYNIKKLLVYYAKKFRERDIQILAPMYRGRYGIEALNHYIQKIRFNDASGEFLKDDLVLQLKNRTKDDIYNGEVGRVVAVDNKIRVSFDQKEIEYSKTEQIELSLAYCISIHKAQGNEYDEIILFLPSNSDFFIDNKILYTAITRPKKKLWIISDLKTINNAIDLTRVKTRQTKLKELLTNSKNDN